MMSGDVPTLKQSSRTGSSPKGVQLDRTPVRSIPAALHKLASRLRWASSAPHHSALRRISVSKVEVRASMTCFRWVSCIALVLAFSASDGGASRAQTPSPIQPSRLSLGVVRGDGILLPLAFRENEEWTSLRSLVIDGDQGVYGFGTRSVSHAKDGPIFRGMVALLVRLPSRTW